MRRLGATRAVSVGFWRAVLANLVKTRRKPHAVLSGVQPPTERHALLTGLARVRADSTRHCPWGQRRYRVLVSDTVASGPRASESDCRSPTPSLARVCRKIVFVLDFSSERMKNAPRRWRKHPVLLSPYTRVRSESNTNPRGAITMRKAFEQQQRLDCSPVLDVRLNTGCRDEIVPILRALQHIYSQPKLRDAILHEIGRDVNGTSKPPSTGVVSRRTSTRSARRLWKSSTS